MSPLFPQLALWATIVSPASRADGIRPPISHKETRIMSASLHRSLALALLLAAVSFAPAADWPQYLGPNRNGSTPETGLLTSWTGAGPKVLWKVEGGDGYGSLAVSGGKVFVLVQRGGDELAIALDATSGKELWKHKLGPAYKNQY